MVLDLTILVSVLILVRHQFITQACRHTKCPALHPKSQRRSSRNGVAGTERIAFVILFPKADQVLERHGFLRGLSAKSERDQIRRGRRHRKRTIEFHFDLGKSLGANINDLLDQASELQATAGWTNYVGALSFEKSTFV